MLNAFGLFTSISLLLLALYAGFSHKVYWSIGIVSFVFTVAYIHSKRSLWIEVYRKEKLPATLVNIVKTYIPQTIVVTILYFIGYGVAGAVFNTSGFDRNLQDIYIFSTIILLAIAFYELLTRQA